MADKEAINAFVERMEKMYCPAEPYRSRAKELLGRMSAPDFPESQVCRIFSLAEDMYLLHATTKSNINRAKEGLSGIASDIACAAERLTLMADAYAKSVGCVVDAAMELHRAGKSLEDAACDILCAAHRVRERSEDGRDSPVVSEKKACKN